MENSKNNLSEKDYVVLSIQAGLDVWGICSSLRRVSTEWDEHFVDIYFIYDGVISDDDEEVSECIATEVLANFFDKSVRTHHIRCDFPEPIPYLGSEVVFTREEKGSK